MGQKALARLIRAIIFFLGFAGCAGFAVFAHILRGLKWMTTTYLVVWLAAVAAALVPCYAVLVLLWRIASTIADGRVFCAENAGRLRTISYLAGADSVFLFAASAVLFATGLSNAYLFCASTLAIVVGIVVTAAAAALSYFCAKAADLQDQSDLTI